MSVTTPRAEPARKAEGLQDLLRKLTLLREHVGGGISVADAKAEAGRIRQSHQAAYQKKRDKAKLRDRLVEELSDIDVEVTHRIAKDNALRVLCPQQKKSPRKRSPRKKAPALHREKDWGHEACVAATSAHLTQQRLRRPRKSRGLSPR